LASATLTAVAALVPSPPRCLADDQEEVLRPAIGFQMRLARFIVIPVLGVAACPATLLPGRHRLPCLSLKQ
jgi:hypothetical protein